MSEFVTKEYFDHRLDGVVAAIREEIRGVISHFNQSQHQQNERFDLIDQRFERMEYRFDGLEGRFDNLDQKLGHFVEEVTTEKHLHNLVGVLQRQGLPIDEKEVFHT